ncbi:MAG: TrpB-like pyridoxal phosphate-dependent enzyme [Dehalococcoidia bacterium]|jgi:tryptophan synthase beta chain|nr:TrpB-like pyridoxal phosphate-dependent enzyme [Dehalococcoidia bacterium]
MADQKKFLLNETDIPTSWYNIQADLDVPIAPALHPGTGQPAGPDDFAPLFPMDLIMQEVSQDRWIDIPEPVRDVYKIWRPTPLFRATGLEKALGTPAKIFYKYEGVSPAGSHKPNTAVAQAYYNSISGTKRISTETGAGQWGSALAFACQQFGIEAKVFMVRASFDQKPYRKSMMQIWGGDVTASPSSETNAGRTILEGDADSPGSLGIAISEAVEVAAGDENTKYSLGSVLNHVLMHQTVIGQEAIKQMDLAGGQPDMVIGCAGGGSNLAGIAFPFVPQKLAGGDIRFIAVEPAAAPSLTKGRFAYDFGDAIGMTPLLKMHTLGHTFVPNPIHAGGLRYHGMAPLISAMADAGLIEARAYNQTECFEAAVLFASTEGIIPAPEPSHAVKAAIDEALMCKETGEEKSILFHLCGHGHLDMSAYDNYFSGNMVDYALPEEEIAAAMESVPQM